MGKKTISWKTKGMNRDMSVSAFNPEFAFENINLRLATNEGNTMMSWVNERGTKEMVLHIDTKPWEAGTSSSKYESTIKGTVIGTAVINHKLVLFTTDDTGSTTCDSIYVLENSKDSNYDLTGMVLFRGNIGLDAKYPIETLVSYESENIQKVYWTDNKNQPRIVNIVPSRSTSTGYYNNNSFDFIQELQLNEEVTVSKQFGSGEFPAGVIQYAFTYYNKYRQETNIFYTTPLQYISYPDRGGAPDSKIANSFKIVVSNLDNNFEYLRIYSILRTSKDGTPFTKRVQDIEIIGKSSVTVIDNGLLGESIDPTELLYKGGEEIKVKTLEQKDGTLFLGNLQLTKPILEIKESLMVSTGVSEESPLVSNSSIVAVRYPRIFKVISKDPLAYVSTLSNADDRPYEGASVFKSGEYYRLGVQFQYKTGQWSEPCWIGDMQCRNNSTVNESTGGMAGAGFMYQPPVEVINQLYDLGYRKIRPLFAAPDSSSKTILCQGIGCPTVYRSGNRTSAYTSATGVNSTIYGTASWLFRMPVDYTKLNNDWNVYTKYALRNNPGGYVTDKNSLVSMYRTPYDGNITSGQVQYYIPGPYISSTEIMGYYNGDDDYNVDGDLITLNSPEIDNSDDVLDFEGCSVFNTGAITFDKTYGDIEVQTSSPTIGILGKGFNHINTVVPGNAALITGILYNDSIVDDKDSTPTYAGYDGATWQFPIYMWHRSGSLNNDVARSGQSAVLKKKIISNYRHGSTTGYNKWYDNKEYYDMSALDMQLFRSNEVTTVKVNGNIYEGNINTMVTPSLPSPHYLIKESGGLFSGGIAQQSAKESVAVVTTSDAEDSNTEDSTRSVGGIIDLPIPPIDSITGGDSSASGNLGRELWMLGINKTSNYSENDLLNNTVGLYYSASDLSNNRFTWALSDSNIGDSVRNLCLWKDSVSIKYKSTPHVVIQLPQTNQHTKVYTHISYAQAPVLEIVKPYDKSTFFGGTSSEVMKSLTWIPCGPSVRFNKTPEGTLPELEVDFKWGDCYFQRWDCLKTYPFTSEDINQVVEIASFMIETRINIDGRYDKNRGQTSNLYMTPQNYNLINPVYSQMDNFFSYKMLDEDDYKNIDYPNTITWTKTKESGSDVDQWTNLTLASTLEMDGNKGEINKLVRFNNQLLSFQDSGIAQILYNEQTQITTTEGVPLEISNSQKVQGKRYFSDTIGCSNKWSIAQTPSGIYFIDSNDKSIYLFNGQLANLSTQGGFNSWAKQNIPSASTEWTPNKFDNFVTYYDKLNQDILFIGKDTALAYSEKFSCFTSFYDYEGASYLNSIDDVEIWIKGNKLWKHQAGDYCKFFGVDKSFSITLIGNQEPQADKMFTNMEFRACVEGEGSYTSATDKFSPLLPFDTLEVWNEYQHGLLSLTNRNSNYNFNHSHTEGETFLNRKFRMWRCDIPRDNAAVDETTESKMGIRRFKARPLDRIRNPWAYLKLKKNKADGKVEVHDIVVSYFGS